ncbi:FtsX-like permease family protein [Dactylosporangium sp. NPDC051541]|uniref:FtsX-like permease family protein n=1 Tax=Dactylosporangium sp. NPDC051541 TaxID=3363977 RepID=UPI0037907EA6
MIRLAVAELRADWRLWIGPLMVTTIAAALIAVAAGHWWAVDTPAVAAAAARAGTTVAEVRAAAYILYVCTALAAVVVLGTVSSATIDAMRVRIARWRLTGAQPLQVGLVILLHVAAIGVAGTAAGFGIALAATEPVVNLLVATVTGAGTHVDATPGPPVLAFTLALTVAVCVAGAVGPARRAARVPAVEAVRAPAPTRHGMSAGRWVLTGLGVLAIGGMVAASIGVNGAMRGDPELINAGASIAVNLGVAVAVTIALAAPAGLALMIRLWSALVPPRVSTAWFLARHSAAHRITHSTAAVVPLMIGASLYGIMFGIAGTFQASITASGSPGEINTFDTYLMLTPLALLTAVGSVAVVLLNAPARRREFAVLRAAGATPRNMLLMAGYEAVLYALTALILATFSAVAAVLAIAGSLRAAGMPFTPTVDARQALVLCGATLVAMTIAITIPAIAAVRGGAREALAPQ